MTPEEWAQQACSVFLIGMGDKDGVAQCFRWAIAEEREACAKIAIDYAAAYMSEDTWGDGRKCGEQIAAAIRTRT